MRRIIAGMLTLCSILGLSLIAAAPPAFANNPCYEVSASPVSKSGNIAYGFATWRCTAPAEGDVIFYDVWLMKETWGSDETMAHHRFEVESQSISQTTRVDFNCLGQGNQAYYIQTVGIHGTEPTGYSAIGHTTRFSC